MKDYNPVKWIEHNLYMRIIYTIRDYDRLKETHDLLIDESPPPSDGQPRGTATTDPTYTTTLNLEKYYDDIIAVDRALNMIPEEYREGVRRNIVNREKYPDFADRKTWSKWKRIFVTNVGKNLNLI